MDDLRSPIGPYVEPSRLTEEEISRLIERMDDIPAKLEQAVFGLNEEQLDTPYRPGGWTLRQVAHHVADSNLNVFLRFKFALTEENPRIMPFPEDLWAELPDSRMPVEPSIRLLKGLHERLTVLLKSMEYKDFARTYHHPDLKREIRLDKVLDMYVWHSEHHLAQITRFRERMGW
ncbi:YfiT family bacillithiol transferase [Staphylospora marina]|uniref:YfiT family bacillithiol transferase n=1 Tax=Staphylospora marina TaxID=2490858 RepID=UPI000F5B89EE|nr:putative metal-dependent hydrolase [Staphylospora marina]